MFLLCNTDLCVDVKTLLRTDRMTEIGKNYRGVLMRDGSLKLNFKNLDTGTGFNVERYALGVYNELCIALEGLVEE